MLQQKEPIDTATRRIDFNDAPQGKNLNITAPLLQRRKHEKHSNA